MYFIIYTDQFLLTSGASKVKVTVKGAAAVDPESELEHSHHVLEEGKW